MTKKDLLTLIIARLEEDHRLLMQAATNAHSAATHEDNVPDSKYETLALEASYIAQGQANRAQQILINIEQFRGLEPKPCPADSAIRLGALILLEDEDGHQRRLFLGPAAGGMMLEMGSEKVTIITPDSPLGDALLGKRSGDVFEFATGNNQREYEILSVS